MRLKFVLLIFAFTLLACKVTESPDRTNVELCESVSLIPLGLGLLWIWASSWRHQ